MKKLTDVYIKATKGNVKELNLLIKKLVKEGDNLLFESESIESVYIDDPKDKQKVSLNELKRLIDAIPTREEIKRLKAQVNYYKVGYKKAIQEGNERANRIGVHARELEESRDKWIALGEKLTKENDMLSNHYNVLEREIKVLLDNFDKLKQENKQIKNRKFWQIWK